MTAAARSCPTSCCRRSPSMRAFGGVVPEIAARAHVEALDLIIATAMAEAGRELQRPRRRRGGRGSGADRRRHRRADHRQGDRAGAREAADRRQSSRGACADRAAHRRNVIPLLPVPRLRRPHPDRRGARRRRLRAPRHHASTMRSARPSTRPRSCSASAIRAGRRSSRRRAWRPRALHPAAPDDRSARRGFLALRPEDRAAARSREDRAAVATRTSPTCARRSSRPWSTWWSTGCAPGLRIFRERFGAPTALVAAGGVAVEPGDPRRLQHVALAGRHRWWCRRRRCAPTTAP